MVSAFGAWLRGNAQPLSKAQLSRTIGLARISLIVGLVFLHYLGFPNSTSSPFDGFDPSRHSAATFVNSFALFFFFSVVPLLSLISGWLFFHLPAQASAIALSSRIRRRFVSLYLPLVFWNGLFMAILWGLYAADPGHPLFGEINFRFEGAVPLDYINAITGMTRYPVGFQFWFVRDLFVSALISPVLLILLRRAPYMGMIILGGAWLTGFDLWIFFRADVVFFFYLGGFVRLTGARLEVGRKATWALLGIYIVLVTLRTLAPAVVDMEGHRPEWLTGATRAMRLVGVLACWGLFLQLAPTRWGGIAARYGGLAFFLHAIHFPLLAEIKLWLWHRVPTETDVWMVVHYVASVAITVAIGLSLGWLMARHMPRLFAMMNGGRALQAPNSGPGSA
jgi:succinoglycan biosynthesis protein ExoH